MVLAVSQALSTMAPVKFDAVDASARNSVPAGLLPTPHCRVTEVWLTAVKDDPAGVEGASAPVLCVPRSFQAVSAP